MLIIFKEFSNQGNILWAMGDYDHPCIAITGGTSDWYARHSYIIEDNG
jgi:hypothetical protein